MRHIVRLRRSPASRLEAKTLNEALFKALRRTLFLAVGLFLIYRLAAPVSAILLLFLSVFILATVLNPVATWLQQRGVPRMLSAILLVLALFGSAALLIWLALPPLLSQSSHVFQQFSEGQIRIRQSYELLLQRLPLLRDQLPPPEQLLRGMAPNVGGLLGRLGGYVLNVASGLISGLVLVVLVVYTVAQPGPLVAGFLGALPPNYRACAIVTLRRMMEQLKVWALGSLLLGAVTGVLTVLGLYLLGIPNALLYGVIAGVGELLPTIGPILAAIPPIAVTLMEDPWKALWVATFFLALQQFESHILAPLILGSKLHLHPVSMIFTLLVMHTLFGLVGAILAVPVCVILKVCWEELYLKPRGQDPAVLQHAADDLVSEEAALERPPGDTNAAGGGLRRLITRRSQKEDRRGA